MRKPSDRPAVLVTCVVLALLCLALLALEPDACQPAGDDTPRWCVD